MADSSRSHRRTSSSRADPTSTSPWTDSVPLTPITSHAQASNASSSDSVQVFSDGGSRSRSNTPSSLASSTAVTSPESNFGPTKTNPPTSQSIENILQPDAASGDGNHEQRSRSSSHGSGRSRSSPHAEAINSGHHASQTLETIPQAALPPPVIKPAQQRHIEDPTNSAVVDYTDPMDVSNGHNHHGHNADEPGRSNLDRSDRTDSWRSTALVLTELTRQKLHNSSGQKVAGVITLTLSILGTVYLAFRAYTLQKWQAVAELYNWCQNVKPGQGGYDSCQEKLKIPLTDPPYSKMARQIARAEQSRQRRGMSMEERAVARASSDTQDRILFALLGLAVLYLAYIVLILWTSQNSRPRRGSDISWSSQRLWPVNRQHSDHFSPVNVRIAPLHHHTTVSSAIGQDASIANTTSQEKKPTLPSHLRQRRQINVLRGSSSQSDNVRRKSLKSDETLTQRPSWKQGGLPRSDSMSLKDPDDSSTIRSELTKEHEELEEEQPVQIGDALKGTADNDLIMQATNSSTGNNINYIFELRKKLHTRYPKLPYFLPGREDNSDDEPIMTALGADPYDSFNPEDSEDTHIVSQRKNVVLSGFVAVAMAQAGSALASTAGGAIGRNILVQHVEDEAHDIHEMITTGKKRRLTDLANYEAEKEKFLGGAVVRRRVTRQESATCS